MTCPPLRGRLASAALLVVVLLVIGAAASCSSSGDDLGLTDDSLTFHERVATTIGTIPPDAQADLDAAIAAARTSTSTALGDSSTTSIYVPKTTTSTTAAGTSSTTAPSESSTSSTAHVVTPDECKLDSQLINFYTAIKPQVDPNDPSGTATRVAGPVQQSAKGLDQILATSGPDTKAQVTKIIDWLRAAAAGSPIEGDAADGAFQDLQNWFNTNCGK